VVVNDSDVDVDREFSKRQSEKAPEGGHAAVGMWTNTAIILECWQPEPYMLISRPLSGIFWVYVLGGRRGARLRDGVLAGRRSMMNPRLEAMPREPSLRGVI
jgi:hypothetical protein